MTTAQTPVHHESSVPDHKRTEVGVIPKDWDCRRLRDGITLLSGHHVLAKHCNVRGIGTPYLTGPADFPAGSILQTKFTTRPTTLCEAGDILVTVKGSGSGISIVADTTYCISRQLMAIKASAWHSQFLYYSLKQNAGSIKAATTGLIPGLSRSDILDQLLPIPSSPSEQAAIAEALSDVDGLIEALEKLIAKKRAIKQAALQQLLTGKTRLPGFNGKWETKRLGDISTCLPTANNPRADLSEYGEVEYIHYGDIHAHAQPVMDCSRAVLPRINKDRIGRAVELQDGDLVLVDASEDLVGVGKSIEVRGLQGRKVVAGLHTILCRGSAEHWALGFKAYLQFAPTFRALLTREATGISVYAVSKKQLADVELPLPPVPEQKAIVAVLADMDAEIEALERRREKTRQIKQGMMQQLLTGRIRLVTPESQAPAAQTHSDGKASKPHSWAFNEAVIISTLAKHFGNEEFPLGRKRYTKLSYLLHRHAEQQAEGYLKQAAGPYNPNTKYGGPERIALESGYIRVHKNGPYNGFVAADNIAQAEGYFEKWYGPDAIQWLNQFRFTKNDDLEVLATMDMASEELRAKGQAVNVDAVKAVIRTHPEWKAKLDRAEFSDANIARAIEASCELLAATGKDDIPGGT